MTIVLAKKWPRASRKGMTLSVLAAACGLILPLHLPVFAQQPTMDFGGRPAGIGRPGAMTWPSPEAAYNYGYGALRSGHPEMAVKALEYAADNNILLAQYYLARIYGDNSLSYTNHGRAFDLFRKIVDEHTEIDMDEDELAPFVAKSMVALAGYYRSGITSEGVSQDLEQAANLPSPCRNDPSR